MFWYLISSLYHVRCFWWEHVYNTIYFYFEMSWGVLPAFLGDYFWMWTGVLLKPPHNWLGVFWAWYSCQQCCSGNESQNSKLKRWECTKRTLVWKCERANLRQSGHRFLGGYSSFTLLLPLNNLLPLSLKSQWPALRNLQLSGQPSSRYLFIIHLSQQTSLKQLPSAKIFLRFSFQTN